MYLLNYCYSNFTSTYSPPFARLFALVTSLAATEVNPRICEVHVDNKNTPRWSIFLPLLSIHGEVYRRVDIQASEKRVRFLPKELVPLRLNSCCQ